MAWFWRSFKGLALKRAAVFSVLALVAGAVVIGLAIPGSAQAVGVFDFASDPWGSLQLLLGELLVGIASFIGDFVLTLIGLLVEVAQFNNFINSPAVLKGWVIVRDVTNMFFIVILLLIAFGSVFHIEEYQYKKILGKLLIMAVLVNFSKSITGFFIDISQVVMLTFVNGFKEAAAGNFVNGFHLQEIFQFADNPEEDQANKTEFLAAAALALITVVITAAVVAVYLIVFLLRIIALWFLIIISPIAYALSAFPGDARKYSTQWWDYFGKYATTGPILAFFLWLSLAVMQLSPKASELGFQITNSQYDIPAAAITGIGQSEILLSFIVNIILLMGGLWMTQQLGVAGGSLAGKAFTKIQGAGAAIARAPLKLAGGLAGGAVKLAGKGAKGTGRFLWEEATSRLGVEGSLKKWKEGWQKGVDKRASDRVTRQQAIYLKRVEKGKLLQALGSPGHLFTHHWNIKNLGRAATFRLDEVTGKKAMRHRDRAAALKSQISQLEAGVNVPNKSERIKKEMSNSESGINKLRAEKEKLSKQLGVEENGGQKKKLSDSITKLDDAISKRTDGHNYKFGSYIGKSNAEIETIERERSLGEAKKKRDEANRIEDLLKKYNEAKEKGEDTTSLVKELLTPKQLEARNKKIEELEKQQVKLLQQIEAKKTVMEAQGRSKSEILQAQAKNKIEVDGLNNLIAGLRHPDLISSEETEQQASVNKLKQDAATLEAEANRPYITDLDRAPLQSKLAELKEAEYQENKLAGDYAPATDYEIRREQRSEINKEMSSMETDNWQELHKIMKDAIEVGDTTRAAAAYLKATKYGNENEIQNEFGYASDAVGMRQFIENIFIKKLGMAREQALSIASDASYIGEGVKHWGVARAVNVKNGQLEWQGEDDRNREVLAEVRKVDFEGFLRQANRLAWGREVPGLHDLPPDATPEQREEYYARHGTRDFEINTFGKSYFLENWEKFARGLEQKRFNVNLAVKLSSGKNMEELDRLATEEGFVSPEKLDFFHEILDKITEFASTADGEFADINEILELEKQGKT